MSFAYDKPFIVRIAEILTTLAGVYFLFLFMANAEEEPLQALIFLAIGALAVADGFFLQLRRPYAWHINLAVMAAVAAAGLIMYAAVGSQTCLAIAVLMAMAIVSWTMGITRDYFAAPAAE
ncbi:MAG: hypothetical protein LKJ94_08155 [Candidatus Methanomethylophilus sp.]|jgi:hypothetical protein|nr:hypothetical protein [Methanomethylophilus sp.]MCI2075643.1 hypothetical protein [Methanomethylophilus sp.]MCI2093149.1 hypothetical protein [Methanomethylophilus sp.]